jgi:plasmid stability protein
MPNILVRDLPESVHATLQRRAEREGKSLQQYLALELKRIADRPTVEDVLARAERRRPGTVGLARAAEDLADDRSRRR